MKLIFIRHADPDYDLDSLTKKGRREAACLQDVLLSLKPDFIFSSPLGRAKLSAEIATKKCGGEIVIEPWLEEFPATVYSFDGKERGCPWDWKPQEWTPDTSLFSIDTWLSSKIWEKSDIEECYNMVTNEFDALLASHGYVRKDRYYEAKKPSKDTLVFFCHFGVECVLLSRLINISPMLLWHGLIALPSGVTTLVSEEREKGIAYFRMNEFGDEGHLRANKEKPSFSGRFCECYTDKTRHE